MTESEIRQRQKDLKSRLETIKNTNDLLTLPKIKTELEQLTQAIIHHCNQNSMGEFKKKQCNLLNLYKEFSQTPLTTPQKSIFSASFDDESDDDVQPSEVKNNMTAQ